MATLFNFSTNRTSLLGTGLQSGAGTVAPSRPLFDAYAVLGVKAPKGASSNISSGSPKESGLGTNGLLGAAHPRESVPNEPRMGLDPAHMSQQQVRDMFHMRNAKPKPAVSPPTGDIARRASLFGGFGGGQTVPARLGGM